MELIEGYKDTEITEELIDLNVKESAVREASLGCQSFNVCQLVWRHDEKGLVVSRFPEAVIFFLLWLWFVVILWYLQLEPLPIYILLHYKKLLHKIIDFLFLDITIILN